MVLTHHNKLVFAFRVCLHDTGCVEIINSELWELYMPWTASILHQRVVYEQITNLMFGRLKKKEWRIARLVGGV